MIRVEGLAFAYNREPVLSGVDLEVKEGEILGVLGPNGCGKSTLLRLLRGLLTPTSGRVSWTGVPVREISRRDMARRVAVVPQSAPIPFPYRVRELTSMGRFARRRGLGGLTAEDRVAVDRALTVTDTLHLADRSVTSLSGGELQRVLTARALAQETPTLLLDEATSHLDLDHRLQMADLILRLNRQRGTTVIQVSHDLDLAAETSHRVLLLAAEGRPAALGPPEQVLTPETLRRVFRVDVKIEPNPYTGAPRILPVTRRHIWPDTPPRVHVICGGGSGAEILRRLHISGCAVSAGPLNLKDSDEVLATALDLEVVREAPFRPIAAAALDAALALCEEADALIVAPTPWGPGNLVCLTIARHALERGTPVFVVDPDESRDFTSGAASRELRALRDRGAREITDVAELLDALENSPISGSEQRKP